MGSERLYSVPSALVFRSWAANTDPDAVIKRRLLLKNDSQQTLSFRLSLPQHPAFQVSGSLVPDAAPGDVCNVTLPSGGSTSLTVTLHRAHADEIECRDELCVRMADGWLYVPLVALRDTQQPEGGDPSERRTVPGGGEYWSDADSDDEHRQPSVQRRSVVRPHGLPAAGRGSSDGKLTAAAVTEADELDFYAELLKSGPPRAAAAAAAATAVPPSPASSVSAASPARASAAPLAPQSGSRPSSSSEGAHSISQRFSKGAQVRMVTIPSPLRLGDGGGGGGSSSEGRAASTAPHAAPSPPPPRAPEWGHVPPHCDTDELAFYRSLLPRHGAPPPAPREDPRAGARAEARAAIEAGTYFVISGSVCDARGKLVGSVEDVLGAEYHGNTGNTAPHGNTAQLPASDPAHDPAGPPCGMREGFPKLSHQAQPPRGADPAHQADPARHTAMPAARTAAPRRLGAGSLGRGPGGKGDLKSSAMIKGGGTRVQSAAPKASHLLTEADMQANWDALC